SLIRLFGENRVLAVLIVFLLAFGESIAVTYLFVPFSTFMLASGALVLTGRVDVWLVSGASVAGIAAADTCSYWFGATIGRRAVYDGDPRGIRKLVQRAVPLFRRWGVLSLLIGRFVGAARSLLPILAGIAAMPHAKFQIVNLASILLWVPALYLPGILATLVLGVDPNMGGKIFAYTLFGLLGFTIVAAVTTSFMRRRRRAGLRVGEAAGPDSVRQ
ncbi:MAG: DedA family protein, partial [Rhodospirillaceae bacterium]|nr:DedA family protein [Rhodospirillaceae bacterium]